MDEKTLTLYIIYLLLLIGDLLGGYLKVIPPEVVAPTFTLIVGHFLGLQVPQPSPLVKQGS